MTRTERSSGSEHSSTRFLPENFRAVSILVGVGILLLGAILFDVYRDLLLEGNSVRTTLLENIFPLSMALGTAVLGWWWSRSKRRITQLHAAAKGMLAGVVAVGILGGIVLAGQFALDEQRPLTILLQLMIVGAAVGFFYGRESGKKKEVLRRLRLDRDLLGRIQEVAQVGGWEYDGSTDTVTGTDRLHHILGLSEGEEFTIERGLAFYPPDWREEVREKVRRCLDQGIPFDLEAPIDQEENDRRWVRVRGERKNTGLLTGTIQDITEQKRIKQMLKDEQEVLRVMYRITVDHERSFDQKIEDLIDLGRSYLDLPFGHVTRVSAETQKITHAKGGHPLLSPGESCPLGESYCRKTVRQEGLLAVQNAPEEGWSDDPAYDEFGLDTYIGSKIRIGGDIYGTFCFSDDKPRAKAFTDGEKTFVELITLWTSYEVVQRRTTRRLEAQNERLDRFASVVTHDLRNPLTVAMNRVQMATDALPAPAAKNQAPSASGDGRTAASDPAGAQSADGTDAAEHLDATERALERMNDIIDDMLVLTWGRRDTDGGQMEPIELTAAVERCWPNLSTEHASLSIEADGQVNAHKGRLQQLLENIIRNAIEHGGGDVTVTVGALPEEDGQDGFFIEDDGPGIPEEDREKVLEGGYSTKDAGTGLGLSIARAVADAHGWGLSVAEGRDDGARFEVRGKEIWK